MLFDGVFLILLTILAAWILRLNRGVTAWLTTPLFGVVFNVWCIVALRLLGHSLLDWQIWTQTGVGLLYALLDLKVADRFYNRLDTATKRRQWWQVAPVEELIEFDED